MSDDEAVARTTVPAVSNECDISELSAHDGCAGFELLGHAWPTLGAFVADDDDDVLAVRDAAGVESSVEFVLFIEDLPSLSETCTLL